MKNTLKSMSTDKKDYIISSFIGQASETYLSKGHCLHAGILQKAYNQRKCVEK